MISETTFAKGYSSFWREYFPWLKNYVQFINKVQIRKLFSPLDISEKSQIRGTNNIISFNYFKNIKLNLSDNILFTYKESIKTIKNFKNKSKDKYKLTLKNKTIINFQVKKMLRRYTTECIFNPEFPGCGILNTCHGDLIIKNKLIEIKAGERNINPSDIKQIIIYCMLNWLNTNSKYIINEVEIFNPRLGLLWNSSLDNMIKSVTELPMDDCFDLMRKFLIELSDEFEL